MPSEKCLAYQQINNYNSVVFDLFKFSDFFSQINISMTALSREVKKLGINLFRISIDGVLNIKITNF